MFCQNNLPVGAHEKWNISLLDFIGCEEIIQQHFRIQHDAILKQCSDWLHYSEAGDEERKLRRMIEELKQELGKLRSEDVEAAECDKLKANNETESP